MSSEEEDFAPYPADRQADVALRDGSTVRVRPVRPEDAGGLLAFFRSLSEESLTLRFFSSAVNLAGEAERETRVDYRATYGLIATAGPKERIVGHGLYTLTHAGATTAEVAFAIADDYQGRGVASILLGQLAEHAAAQGIRGFEAVSLPGNERIVDLFRQSGFPVQVKRGFDETRVTMPTSLSEPALAVFEQRERVAAANALRWFLAPRSIAVIGASRNRGTVGGELFHNLLKEQFAGPVYPVNSNAAVVQCVPAYASVEQIPGVVDLAVIAVPAAQVLGVAEACGRKSVRALVVLSAGFAETGPEGVARQAALLEVCRAWGMRLIGPNCIGIASTESNVRLNATFGPSTPTQGRVGFASQSGALGLAAITQAGARGLGISSFVSMGNKADISGNDLLNYWEGDPRTDVILLYLESFGNPRKFSRIARRVARRKPILAVKSGRSSAGARAATSHTGALLASSDVTVDALFRQSGVIRVDTLEGLFDAATLLATQPVPAGPRVGMVTNVGGPAILCADACEAHGLQVAPFSEATRARLRETMPAEGGVNNPVDMLATASADDYRRAIRVVGDDPDIDSIIALYIAPLATSGPEVQRAIAEAAVELKGRKPLLAVLMSATAPPPLVAGEVRVPCFSFPESAAIALAHAARYGAWRARPQEAAPELADVRQDEAREIVVGALERGGGWLRPEEVARLLSCYGIPLPRQEVANTPSKAATAADRIGGAVALKAIAPGLIHKTEAGAVKLGLRGAREVRRAATELVARLREAGTSPTGFLVQEMVQSDVEMLVGVAQDRHFGPVVAVGAGGVLVELMRDAAVRLAPLTALDAAEAVRELKCFRLLSGYRGSTPRDVSALEDILLRVSTLAEDLPDVAELDCNPVAMLEHGAVVLDARVRVERAGTPRPISARR